MQNRSALLNRLILLYFVAEHVIIINNVGGMCKIFPRIRQERNRSGAKKYPVSFAEKDTWILDGRLRTSEAGRWAEWESEDTESLICGRQGGEANGRSCIIQLKMCRNFVEYLNNMATLLSV